MLTGKMVFASGQYGDFDIFLLDLATNKLSQLTSDQYWNDYPRLSPDARRVAFTSARGDRQEIRVMDVAGGNSRPVAPDLQFAAFPCWSPDGKQLAFVSTPYFKADLFSLELESGKVRRLTSSPHSDTYPDWSPDGKKIAFCSQRGMNQDIYLLELDSLKEERITTRPGPDTSPAFSPDGKKIAFVSQRSEASERFQLLDSLWDFFYGHEDLEIWVVELGSGKLRQITTDRGVDRNVRWSPDGTDLAFTSSTHGSDARIKICEYETGKGIPFSYDRELLRRELERPLDVADLTKAMTKYSPALHKWTPGFVERFLERVGKRELDQIYSPTERYLDWR
jgi:Tol biopolymer transport system component